MLTPEGTIADGPGETIFVVSNGKIYTPDLSTGILHGITRDSVMQIATDLGYEVREKTLIRTDLYLADEVFMCGTAAEVTPVRSVDDQEIGVGPITLEIQQSVPRHGEGPERPLGAVARARAEHDARVSLGSTEARRMSCRYPDCPQRPWIDERDEELVLEVLRSGRLSLGPAGPAFESAARRRRRRAARRRGLVRHGGAAPLHGDRRRRARRRGDHVAVLVRRLRELRHLRGRDARVRRHRPADVEPRPGRGRGGDHAPDEGGRRRRHLRLPLRGGRAARDLRPPRHHARRGRLRGARRDATRAGRSARTATSPRGRSIRTSRSRPARAAR